MGGLYFSWSSLDDIHGDALKRPAVGFAASLSLVPLRALQQKGIDSIQNVVLIDVVNQPLYQLTYRMQHANGHAAAHVQLANTTTGQLRGELTQVEAVALAKSQFAGESVVEQVAYLTSTNGHHEYREKPLPAYAVTF